MALTALLTGALTWLQQSYLLRLETRMAVTSSSRFLWHVLRLPVEFFSQRFAGDIGSRVGINDRVAQLLSRDLATNVLGTLMIVFFGAVMFQYDAGADAGRRSPWCRSTSRRCATSRASGWTAAAGSLQDQGKLSAPRSAACRPSRP